MDFFAVKVDQVMSYVKVMSYRSKWRQSDVLQIKVTSKWCLTDSWVDIISVSFNSKKVHEDDIFVRQEMGLQFFSVESKDYKYLKSQ